MSKKTKKNNDKDFLTIKPFKTSKDGVKTTDMMEKGVIPKHPYRLLISGASGSGKSNLLLDLLCCSKKYKNYYDYIFVLSPTAGHLDDSYKALKKSCKKTKLFIINELNPDQIQKIMDTQEEIIKEKGLKKTPRILLIYDDIINDKKFMNSKEFIKSFVASRHYNMSVIVLTQRYHSVPRVCRLQANNVLYFLGSASENARLVDEFTPPRYSKKEFDEMVTFATREPYSFLYVNMTQPFKTRYRKCLHSIMTLDRFEENEKEEKKDCDESDSDSDDEGDEENDEGDDKEDEKNEDKKYIK